MHHIVLLMIIFNGSQLVQVVEPIPGATFESVEVCERVSKKFLDMPLPEGMHDVAVCIDSR